MKIKKVIYAVVALFLITACSKSDDEEIKQPLVNHSNKGDMEKQLEGTAFQDYGKDLDKAHNVTDTLQKSADQTQQQVDQQSQ